MSAIDSNLLNIAPSAQDLLDETLVNGSLGEGSGGAGGSGGSGGVQESPQEKALDALNDYTHSAQQQFTKELMEGVPDDLLDAQQMTSTLVGGIVASATEALAAAAQKLSPESVLGLLQD